MAKVSDRSSSPGRSFSELLAHLLPRQAEAWEVSTSSALSKLWAGVDEEETPLLELLSAVELGQVGDFESLRSLVCAARLLVQAKLAGGAPVDTASQALAFYVLTLLDARAREKVNSCWQSEA